MTRITLVIFAVRLLAIGQVLLVALVIARTATPRRIRLSSGFLLLCTCAFLVLQTPLSAMAEGPFWPLLPLAAQLVPLALWVFANVLFERQIDRRIAVLALIMALSCWATLGMGRIDAGDGERLALLIVAQVQRVSQLALVAHAIAIALHERGDDLIEKRRRLRVGFVIVVAVQAITDIVLEFFFGFEAVPPGFTLVQMIAILIATFALGGALLQSDPDLLHDPDTPTPPATGISPSEHVLKGKLDAAMADGIYRETGLTIGQLATRLGTPEHRLRALINQRLGYRNFSAFLNAHRINEAKTLLADPAQVDRPILTIPMDLGYASLAPFNRAFRDTAGLAPSEFRRAQIVRN